MRRWRGLNPEDEAEMDRELSALLLGNGEGEEVEGAGSMKDVWGEETGLDDATSGAGDQPTLEQVARADPSDLTWVQRRVRRVMKEDDVTVSVNGDETCILELYEWMQRLAPADGGGAFAVGANAITSVYRELEREKAGEFNSDEEGSMFESDPVKRSFCRLALEIERKGPVLFQRSENANEREQMRHEMALAKSAIAAGMPREEMARCGIDTDLVDWLQDIEPQDEMIHSIADPGTSGTGQPRFLI